MRLSRAFAIVLAGLALLSSGCLDFDKQTAVLTYDAGKDEAHILMLYEGLQVTGQGDDSVKRARETFEEFFVTGKGFYAGHPMLRLRLVPEERKPGQKPNPRDEKAEKLMLHHVSIGDRALFSHKNGLSGMQVVHIKQAGKFLAGLNELISEEILENTDKKLTDAAKPGSKIDVEALRLQQKAARDKHQWLRFEQGRLSLHLVGTPKFFESVKHELFKDMILKEVKHALNPPPSPGKPEKTAAEILDEARRRIGEVERAVDFAGLTPLSFDLRKNSAVLSLGLGDDEPIRVFSPYMATREGRPAEVVEIAKTFKVPMLKEATAKTIIDDFLKKYPPKK